MKFILLSFILCSCSFFIGKFKDDSDGDVKLKVKKKTFCPKQAKSEMTLMGKNKKLQKSFEEFLKKLGKRGIYLRSIEKSVAWSLLQINSRPDMASPTSRYQVLMRIGKKEYFYDFKGSSQSDYPFLYGLDYILRNHSRGRSLLTLARLIELYHPNSFFIGESFAKFLIKNKDIIKTNSSLQSFYTRGNELLQEGERIPKIKMTKLIQNFIRNKKKSKIQRSSKLFDFQKSKAYSISCNINMKLYQNSVFLISKKEISGHTYGLKTSNFTYLASNVQRITNFASLNNTPAFIGSSNMPMPNLCTYKYGDNKQGYKMWLVSGQSRDPGQHLFHLYQYGLEQIKEVQDLDTLLRFSRHFFLSDPLRLIFESQRGTEAQLNELLGLNVPLYNALSLGNIWGHIKFTKGEDHFVLDDRSVGELSCLK